MAAALLSAAPIYAADIKANLSKEQVGKPPLIFEPLVGTWLVAEDVGEKVIVLDGRARPCKIDEH
jgi:hypothetical protein